MNNFECKNHGKDNTLGFDTREQYILHLETDIARIKEGEKLGVIVL